MTVFFFLFKVRPKSSIYTFMWNNRLPGPFCRGVSPLPAPLRESVIPVTKIVSPRAEIDIFEAMDINAQTVGLQKVQGLEGESGDAYKIEENISRKELPSSYLEQIRFLLNNKRRMVIMANVKMMHHSRGTLFSLERRRKGMNWLRNIDDKLSRCTLF